MRPPSRTAEKEIARIAVSQHGLVTRAQLLAAGLSEAGVQRRVQKGGLFREYAGVYRVGHRALSLEATYLAAVLAGGDDALLSGQAAGHLLYLLRGAAPPPEITTRTERHIPGVKTRHVRMLDGREATVFRGIPVTTVPRTLVDLAAVLDQEDLARACHEAEVMYRTTPARVEAVLARRPNSPGAAQLKAVLGGDVHVTLSKLERRFLERVREIHRPMPRTNRPAGGRYVDCRWPEHELTVELDSYQFHNSSHAWEQDRRRDREARARGDEFRRYTYRDVFDGPGPMLTELRHLLPRCPA